MTIIYESGAAGAFMYMWGYHDAQHNVTVPPGLLLNNQNPLDMLLGDLFGAVTPKAAVPAGVAPTVSPVQPQRRWFIAELKQDRDGFYNEVHSSKAKSHRSGLYAHLRADQVCRNLSRTGHFAIWHQIEGIVIAPYAHTVGPGPAGGPWPGPGVHELDANNFISAFDRFYANLNEPDMIPFAGNPLLYRHGLGLPIAGMRMYLECMLKFYLPLPVAPGVVVQATDELLFGYVGPAGGAVLAKVSFEGLLAGCAAFMNAVAAPYVMPKHQ